MARGSEKGIWLEAAERHLGMAKELSAAGFHEGTLFHAYHALECFVCAGLSAGKHDPSNPPDCYKSGYSIHVAKLNWFADEFRGQPVAADTNVLRIYLRSLVGPRAKWENDLRNACLYHIVGELPPWRRFGKNDCNDACERVRTLLAKHAPAL